MVGSILMSVVKRRGKFRAMLTATLLTRDLEDKVDGTRIVCFEEESDSWEDAVGAVTERLEILEERES